ncbi:MAG: Panacea domain-containing protein [Candidatus Taylorbacteria bacterium]|nr:Panacea domain-containing protein [Candidatus Taylorbacteria bacterium]
MNKLNKMVKINEKKYRNAILFFAKKIQNGTLGKLKMMKLLYYLDFDFFEKYGRSVTGDEYLRFDNGPVPRMAEKILKEMKDRGIKITSHKVAEGYNDQQRIEATEDFDLNVFDKEELVMLEEVADKWEKFTGTEMKTASHGEAPWISTKPNDVIDYNLAYYRNKYGEMANL